MERQKLTTEFVKLYSKLILQITPHLLLIARWQKAQLRDKWLSKEDADQIREIENFNAIKSDNETAFERFQEFEPLNDFKTERLRYYFK